MNPLTQTRNLTKLIEREVKLEVNENASWHKQYKDSAWIFIGGLDFGLNEGDIISVFSQYGEVANINLVRDKKTGKSKGYCFLCYEDQRSTVLSVDNFNGIKLCKRMIRVDHVENYRVPKDSKEVDEETKRLRDEGCGPEVQLREASGYTTREDVITPPNVIPIKQERHDPGYDKYEKPQTNISTESREKNSHHSKSERNESRKRKKDDERSGYEDRDQSRNGQDRNDKHKSHKSKDRVKHEKEKRESHDSKRDGSRRDHGKDVKRDTNDHKHSKRKH